MASASPLYFTQQKGAAPVNGAHASVAPLNGAHASVAPVYVTQQKGAALLNGAHASPLQGNGSSHAGRASSLQQQQQQQQQGWQLSPERSISHTVTASSLEPQWQAATGSFRGEVGRLSVQQHTVAGGSGSTTQQRQAGSDVQVADACSTGSQWQLQAASGVPAGAGHDSFLEGRFTKEEPEGHVVQSPSHALEPSSQQQAAAAGAAGGGGGGNAAVGSKEGMLLVGYEVDASADMGQGVHVQVGVGESGADACRWVPVGVAQTREEWRRHGAGCTRAGGCRQECCVCVVLALCWYDSCVCVCGS